MTATKSYRLGFVKKVLIATPMLWPTAIMAQPQCDEHSKVIDHLAKKWNESVTADGVTSEGGLIEVLKSAEGKTWTIIITTPRGLSCLVGAGEGWREIKPVPVEPEA